MERRLGKLLKRLLNIKRSWIDRCKEIDYMEKRIYNVLDLFCGCGGLSKGFEMANYNIVLGVDFNEPALKTYKFNHKDSMTLCGDLSNSDTFDTIDSLIEGKPVDVIIGGPPCQGFSLTGPRNFDDERNKLYLAMIETVKRYSPKAFMIENVPGMATLYKGEVKDEIIRRFTEMGYNVNCKILCAADYGVPQMRKRLVFVGVKWIVAHYYYFAKFVKLCKFCAFCHI